MSWAAVIELIIALLPLMEAVLRWLEGHLKRAATYLDAPDRYAPHAAVAELFQRALAELPPVAPFRRLLLHAVWRIAAVRAPEIMHAAKTGGTVGDLMPLTPLELEQLNDVGESPTLAAELAA